MFFCLTIMNNKEYYDSINSAINIVKERIQASQKSMADIINSYDLDGSKNQLWNIMESINIYEMILEKLRKEV